MNAENQLLQPTGQATPDTKNDQVAPGLNITQPGDQLQYSDQSLFLGASNAEIVVLKQNGTVAAATTSPGKSLAQQNNPGLPLLVPSILLTMILAFVVVIKLKSNQQDNKLENG